MTHFIMKMTVSLCTICRRICIQKW